MSNVAEAVIRLKDLARRFDSASKVGLESEFKSVQDAGAGLHLLADEIREIIALLGSPGVVSLERTELIA